MRLAVVCRPGDGLRAALLDVPLARLVLVAAEAGMLGNVPQSLGGFVHAPRAGSARSTRQVRVRSPYCTVRTSR